MMLVVCCLPTLPAFAVTQTQTISRENVLYNWAATSLNVGRDGKVYLCNGGQPNGYLMRINRDGTMKTDTSLTYCALATVANANGIMAIAEGHFTATLALRKPDFTEYATIPGFNVGQCYDAPADVTVGASGDFYALDQYATNGQMIRRINAAGQTVATYNYPTATIPRACRIKVCEATQTFYILNMNYTGTLCAVGFDGTIKWSKTYTNTGVYTADMRGCDYLHGGFDVDDAGTLYTIPENSNVITKWDGNGNSTGTVTLSMGSENTLIAGLAVFGNEALILRHIQGELFHDYNLTTGVQNRIVSADVDTLSMTYSSEVWTAGTQLPFTISYTSSHPNTPVWHVWGCPNDSTTYREFTYSNGQLTIPSDCTGLYNIKLTPECEGMQRGGVAEYRVYDLVEIRKASAPGTLTVYTTGDRVHYGAGESVNFTVSCRAPDANVPSSVTVQLLDPDSTVVATGSATLTPAQKTVGFFLPASLTMGLRPGTYKLTLTDPNLTCVPQYLVFGRGLTKPPFKITMYGDYGSVYVTAPVAQERDLIANRVTWLDKTGINMTSERLTVAPWANTTDSQTEITNEVDRLTADAVAADPQKANPDPPLRQNVAAYSAGNTEQMSILLCNDADIPIDGSWSFDGRSIAQLQSDITSITNNLLDFPAFRGWCWAANWWQWETDWSNAALNPTEKANFESAVTTATQPGGAWSSIIDTVSDRRLGYPPATWAPLNSTLATVAPGKITATSGPYRNVDSYPPQTFSNVNETDMQAQWEQYPLPYHTLFGVDYYKRPGKKLWQHPEVWNDTGTGEQAVTDTMLGVMRGTDGSGWSSTLPAFNIGDVIGDGRNAYRGTVSVYRAMNTQHLQRFGPWFTGMTTKDPIAIVASARMGKIDQWGSGSLPAHFAALYEAYVSLMMAHYPASLVFTDDMTTTSLNGYKAVFLVDQRVEMDPNLQLTIANAQAAGAAVYYDGTCDATRFTGLGYTALGISFNHFVTAAGAGSDIGQQDMLLKARANVSTLTTALASITPPAIISSSDEVFVTERDAESGRYIFVVNNCQPNLLTPAQMWRIGIFAASRLPLQTIVTLPNLGTSVVYDALAQAQVTPNAGQVTADLRSVPIRVFAVLPKAINNVALVGPSTAVTCGQPFNWQVTVRDNTNTAIAASIPVRVQLLSNDRLTVLQERYLAAGSAGVSGSFTLPQNPSGGAPRLRVTELLSGLYAEQTLSMTTAGAGTIPLQGDSDPGQNPPVPATLTTAGSNADTIPSAASAFGPHIRDIAISADGTKVLCSTMNWDHNLYAADLASGSISWRKRIGNYYAYDAQTVGSGFAAQGFNFNDAEGYGLYLIGSDGTLTRRFNAYGIPACPIGWLLSAIIETPSSYNFAESPDGTKIASAANLGLVVWDNNGNVLWSQDWSATRQTARLAATNTTLFTATGLTIDAYNISTGVKLWERVLSAMSGDVTRLRVSADGSTCVALTNNLGGTVYAIACSSGNLLGTFPTSRSWGSLSTAGSDIGISPTGTLIAVANVNQVTLYSTTSGYQWIFAGDTPLHFPRFSPDGARLAVCSELGTLYVLNTSGVKLLERDMGAIVAPAWVANGDLILGGWNGKLTRLNGSYTQVWQTALTPTETDIRNKILDADGAPVTKMTGWSNALPTPYPLNTSILTTTNCRPESYGNPDSSSYHIQDNIYLTGTPQPSLLVDGSATPPASPWNIAALTPGNTFCLQINTWNRVMRVDAVTFAEDPAHPESWLRDTTVQYLEPLTQTWMNGPALRSDVATHTHLISPSITTSQIRFNLPPKSTAALRLGEVAIHGALLGGSHPDVFAQRDTAVLFDEGTDFSGTLGGSWSFQMTDAYSGARCLNVAGYAPSGLWTVFGPSFPNWYFVVSANPQPGQYRYLTFSWKATSANVTGMEMGLFCANLGGRGFFCGTDPGSLWGAPDTQVSTTVPTTWTTVTIDLSQYFTDGTVLTNPFFNTAGGNALFDRIMLSRTGTCNEIPSVTLTCPGNGLAFSTGSNLQVSANASDLDGTINRVEFYQGSTLIGTSATSPYSITWNNVAAGVYTLTAKVFDNTGASATSLPISITVDNAPTVSVTAPTGGMTYAAPASIPVTATASDADGTIAKVGFYLNGTWLGDDTTSPYTFTMTNVGVGSYAITAKATDNLGMVTESSPVNVTVTDLPTTGRLLWLKADAITGLANGNAVNTWYDSSGNGRNAVFTQVNGVGVAPVYTTNVFNGKPVVRFSGNSLLQVSSLPLGAYTIIAVFKTSANNQILYEHSDGMLTNNSGNFLFTSTNSTVSVKRNSIQTGKDIVMSNAGNWAANPAMPIMTTDTFGSTDASETFAINGSLQLLNENYVGNLNDATVITDHFNIGERQWFGSLPFSGDLAEIVVYDHVLSPADMQTVSNALISKYGLDLPPTVTLTAPTGGTVYTAPANVTLTATASDTDGSISKVEFYNGYTLIGTANSSPYSYAWSNVAAGSYTLTAMAYDNHNITAVSASANITVDAPPTVSITAPTPGQVFTAPATITINATAGDSDGTITKVEFYNGGTLLGTDSTSPYSYTWSNVASGSYTLTAKAYDNSNVTTTSSGVNVISDTAPTVSITSPTGGTVFTAPATITINANAGDSDGTISKAEFYQGSTLIGTVSTSPYSYTWSNVASGSYTLTAKAYDNNNITTTSSGVNVISDTAPTVSLTAPANNTNYIASASVALSATASDSDGTISKVEFYQGSTLIGTVSTSPYNYTWNSVAMGNYSLTAKAYDNNNITTTSGTVNIVVWGTSDIGTVGVAGSASYSSGTFTVSGAGAGVTSTADAFRFVYRQFSGNTTIIARVATAASATSTERAGVMMRKDLTAGSIEASSMYKPTSTYYVYFLRRTTANGSTSSTASTTAAAPPYWVKLVRSSNTLSAFMSANGSTWTAVGSGTTVTMTDPIYVGLAVTSGSTSAAKTVTFDNVSITQP